MAFEELKEQLVSRLSDVGSKIEDSTLYQNLKEKYDDLPASQQKIVLALAAFILGFFILSFPYDNWSLSQDGLAQFSERRDVIRDLLRVTKETNEAISFPAPPPIGQIQTDLEMRLQQFQLSPEQMGGVEVKMNTSAGLIPSARQEGALKVSLRKLNLRQLVDITAQLQSLHSAVKLGSLSIDSHPADPRYLDAALELIVIKIPQVSMETSEEDSLPRPGRNPRGRN